MSYFNNSQANILGLKNLNTGNQLKAGDQTVLQYRLTDMNNDELDLQGKEAKVYLKQNGKSSLLTTTSVDEELEVQFPLDMVLKAGSYDLEIVVEDTYFFPSDNSEQIVIYPSYLSLVEEDLGYAPIEEFREYILEFIHNAIEGITYVAGNNVIIDENNVISAIDTELWAEVRKKQDKLTAGMNIVVDEATGLISAVDTVYDDTAIREELDKKQGILKAGTNVTIDEDGTIHTTYSDTIFDDAELRAILENKQAILAAGENIRIDANNRISAIDTKYDDAELRQMIKELEKGISRVEVQEMINESLSNADIGLSQEEVENLIANAIAGVNVGLTQAQVMQMIRDALEGYESGMTVEEVQALIDASAFNSGRIDDQIEQLRADVEALQAIIDNGAGGGNPGDGSDVPVDLSGIIARIEELEALSFTETVAKSVLASAEGEGYISSSNYNAYKRIASESLTKAWNDSNARSILSADPRRGSVLYKVVGSDLEDDISYRDIDNFTVKLNPTYFRAMVANTDLVIAYEFIGASGNRISFDSFTITDVNEEIDIAVPDDFVTLYFGLFPETYNTANTHLPVDRGLFDPGALDLTFLSQVTPVEALQVLVDALNVDVASIRLDVSHLGGTSDLLVRRVEDILSALTSNVLPLADGRIQQSRIPSWYDSIKNTAATSLGNAFVHGRMVGDLNHGGPHRLVVYKLSKADKDLTDAQLYLSINLDYFTSIMMNYPVHLYYEITNYGGLGYSRHVHTTASMDNSYYSIDMPNEYDELYIGIIPNHNHAVELLASGQSLTDPEAVQLLQFADVSNIGTAQRIHDVPVEKFEDLPSKDGYALTYDHDDAQFVLADNQPVEDPRISLLEDEVARLTGSIDSLVDIIANLSSEMNDDADVPVNFEMDPFNLFLPDDVVDKKGYVGQEVGKLVPDIIRETNGRLIVSHEVLHVTVTGDNVYNVYIELWLDNGKSYILTIYLKPSDVDGMLESEEPEVPDVPVDPEGPVVPEEQMIQDILAKNPAEFNIQPVVIDNLKDVSNLNPRVDLSIRNGYVGENTVVDIYNPYPAYLAEQGVYEIYTEVSDGGGYVPVHVPAVLLNGPTNVIKEISIVEASPDNFDVESLHLMLPADSDSIDLNQFALEHVESKHGTHQFWNHDGEMPAWEGRTIETFTGPGTVSIYNNYSTEDGTAFTVESPLVVHEHSPEAQRMIDENPLPDIFTIVQPSFTQWPTSSVDAYQSLDLNFSVNVFNSYSVDREALEAHFGPSQVSIMSDDYDIFEMLDGGPGLYPTYITISDNSDPNYVGETLARIEIPTIVYA